MTKTSFSRGTQDLQDRELRDDELDAVTGGLVVNAIIAVLIGLLIPDTRPPTPPQPASK